MYFVEYQTQKLLATWYVSCFPSEHITCGHCPASQKKIVLQIASPRKDQNSNNGSYWICTASLLPEVEKLEAKPS